MAQRAGKGKRKGGEPDRPSWRQGRTCASRWRPNGPWMARS